MAQIDSNFEIWWNKWGQFVAPLHKVSSLEVLTVFKSAAWEAYQAGFHSRDNDFEDLLREK